MIKWTSRQQAVLDAKGNLLVSASAGSGKTTVMLEKVLQLLKGGADLSKMLLITFSRTAAAEMKEKFIEKLYDELSAKPDKHLSKQLEQLNFAAISTIDSFYFSLFKKYYAVLGMDPAFELFDEKEAALLFSESVEDALETYLEKGDDGLILLIERLSANRSLAPLKEQIRKISAFFDVLPDVNDFVTNVLPLSNTTQFDRSPVVEYYLNENKKSFRRDIDRLERIAEECSQNNMPKFAPVIEEITSFLQHLTQSDYRQMETALTSEWKFSNSPRGKKDESQTLIADEFKFLKGKITEKLRALQQDFQSSAVLMREVKESSVDVEKLVEITLYARELYQKAKYKQQKLDFADLSVLARSLLSTEEVQKDVQEQYEYVFVDEYQDVNYLQESIIQLLDAKNLFVVGDPKQSIYQFRRTEPKIFLNRERKYLSAGGGNAKHLNDNFRSDKRVLDFINLIFNEVMTYEFGGADYRETAQLISGAEYPVVSSVPAVEVALYDGSTEADEDTEEDNTSYFVYSVKDGERADAFVDGSSAYIAEKVQSLVGKEKIYDPTLKGERVIMYSDIAVLMKNKKGEALFKAFSEANIPYAAENFKESSNYEKELLVNILRAANNISEDIPLTAVMLSPLYEFHPKELLEIRSFNREIAFWAAVKGYKGDPKIENKIKDLLFDLQKIQELNSFCGVNEIMWRICDGKYGAFLASRGKEAKERVETFISSCDGEYARYIGSFLQYYDEVYDGEESVPSMGNAVTVSTIHKSKGLEYPIVFVAYADKGFRLNFISNTDIFIDSEFGLAAKHFDPITKKKSDTILTRAFKMKKTFEEKQELLRVMYVALTRAKNHLFIVGKEVAHSDIYSESQSNFVQWISLAAEKNPQVSDFIVNYIPSKSVNEPLAPQTSNSAVMAGVAENSLAELFQLDYVYPYAPALTQAAKYSVTALQKLEEVNYEYDTIPIKELFPEEREAKISKGILYHKILEKVEFKDYSAEKLAEFVRINVEEGNLPEECLSLPLQPVLGVLSSDLIKLAKTNQIQREKSFMLYLPLCEVAEGSLCEDKVLVQGVIDLLITGNENIIVDFKVSQNPIKAIQKRYKKQLDLYALAAEEAMGISHFRKIIYLVGRDEIIEL